MNGTSHEAPATVTESETLKDTSAGPPTTTSNTKIGASPAQRVSHPSGKDDQIGAGTGEVRDSAGDARTFAREADTGAPTRVDSIEVVSASPTRTSSLQRPSDRPPLVLDASITVLLVLVAALLCRKLL